MSLRLLLLSLVVAIGLSASAQEPEERYYPYQSPYDEPYRPMIQSDTSLFYRALQQSENHYRNLTRYAFQHIGRAYRGVRFSEREWYYGCLPLDYSNFSLLRALGASQSDEYHLDAALEQRATAQRLQLHLRTSRYRVGGRYEAVFALSPRWQVELYADGRWGEDLRVAEQFQQTLRMALRAHYRPSERWSLCLAAAVAPSRQARSQSTTEEVYRLVGDNYYNPAWGFDRGRPRSARIRREVVPMLSATLEFAPTLHTTFTLQTLFEAGYRAQGSLGWFDASTPQPDNYRRLPSYYEDPELAEQVAAAWRAGDTRYTQIDWQELYTQNRLSNQGARYVEQEAVERIVQTGLHLMGHTHIGAGLELRYGFWGRVDARRNYLRLKDLLGADYLLDIDYFLVDDHTYFNRLENNLRNPGHRATQGDRFGYDYALHELTVGAMAGLRYQTGRWHLGGELELQRVSYRRYGHFEKELFAGEGSYGGSKRLHFSPYSLALHGGVSLTPRDYLRLTATYVGRAPEPENLFLQSRYNNRTVDAPHLEQHLQTELGYYGSREALRWSLVAFLDLQRHGMEVSHYYDDLSGLFSDRVTTHIATRYFGVEAGATLYLSRRWQLRLAASALKADYVDNPRVTLYADTDNRVICSSSESFVGGCQPGGVPAVEGLLGVNYYGRGWGFTLQGSYAALRYAHIDFMRRTQRVVGQAVDSEESFNRFMQQERLADALNLELSAWKSFRLDERHALTLYLAFRNLLNDSTTPYGSYESGRIRRIRSGDGYTYLPFDNRLSYAAPRSAYLSLSFRF